MSEEETAESLDEPSLQANPAAQFEIRTYKHGVFDEKVGGAQVLQNATILAASYFSAKMTVNAETEFAVAVWDVTNAAITNWIGYKAVPLS